MVTYTIYFMDGTTVRVKADCYSYYEHRFYNKRQVKVKRGYVKGHLWWRRRVKKKCKEWRYTDVLSYNPTAVKYILIDGE